MGSARNSKPDHLLEDGLVVKSQLVIFLLAFLLAWFVGPFVPHGISEAVYKTVDMLFVCGTILLAVKLAREGWDMAAAGYTILGIAWGIYFAAMDFNNLGIGGEVRISAAYFFMPCMILISFYRPFPLGLKLLTVFCMIPCIVALILQKINPEDEPHIFLWLELGFGLFHITSVWWGIFFYRQYRRHLKALQESVVAEQETLSKPISK